MSRERGLDVDAQVEVFENEQDLYRAFAAGNVDASSMTVEEFFAISQHADFVYRPARASGYTESYVVLARGKAGVDHLRGLKGRKLVRHVHPATGPALPWLETLLAELGLDRAVDFFGETSEVESPSKAVLRVFFGQADACLVTSEAFDVACELNPQLRKELRVLATSPAVVPSVFVFRTGYESPVRRELEAAILSLHSTPAGQQVLTVFQATRMEKLPFSALETTRQLFERYDRLIGKRESVTGAVGLSKGGSRP